MPEKDGDEGKSTKSVVNKKQKQMMGEEGYDIARDMGRVKPSKDKKDATTMPPSKEMKKTQKVNKGPSAFERVKAKYGKSVMNVGKKKANEELDLTQVAEALGGYIVEAPLKSLTGDPEEIEKRIKKGAAEVTGKRKERGARALAKAAGIKLATQGPEQAAATQAFKDMRMSGDEKFSDLTPDTKTGMRATAAGKGRSEPEDEMMASSGGKKKGEFKAPTLSPTSGGRRIKKTLSQFPPGPERAARKAADDLRKKDMMKSGRIGGRDRKSNPRGDAIKALTNLSKEAELEGKRKDYLDPKTNKASPEGIKKYITKARQMRSGSNVPVDKETTDNIAKIAGKEYADKINQKYGGRRAGRRQSTATPPAFATRTGESGGPLPVSMRNRRVPKTSSLSTPVTTTPTFKSFQDKVKTVTPEVVGGETKKSAQLSKTPKEGPVIDTTATRVNGGTGQRNIFTGETEPPKDEKKVRGFKSDTNFLKPPKNYNPDQLELDFNQKPEKPSFADFEKRRFKAPDIPKPKTALQDPPKKISTDTETQTQTDSGTGGTGGGRRIKKKFGPGGPNKPFTPIKSAREFARKDPVAALGAYDLGKGILGKIMKTRMPSLQARSGFRSAKGGGGL